MKNKWCSATAAPVAWSAVNALDGGSNAPLTLTFKGTMTPRPMQQFIVLHACELHNGASDQVLCSSLTMQPPRCFMYLDCAANEPHGHVQDGG